ncbi:hypothetical protein BOX15_Mlig016988g4, partial [Macrostomum lignano]
TMLPFRLVNISQQIVQAMGTKLWISHQTRGVMQVASCSTNTLTAQLQSSQSEQQHREVDDLIARMQVQLKGHDPAVMDSYEKFVCMVSQELSLPMRVEDRNRPHFVRLTLNRSPFIHKKHMRQYEFRTYCKTLHFSKLTGSTASVFLEYIQRNLPEGMAMQVRKERLEPLTEFLHKLNGEDAVAPTDSSNN